jgi:hypothetical protein
VHALILSWREAAEHRLTTAPVIGPLDPGDYRLPDARGPVDLRLLGLTLVAEKRTSVVVDKDARSGPIPCFGPRGDVTSITASRRNHPERVKPKA